MPYIYNDMYWAKLAIKRNHGDDARKYGSFWSVIDNHWNPLFHRPLYLAAYFLNPSFWYRPDFVAVRENDACLQMQACFFFFSSFISFVSYPIQILCSMYVIVASRCCAWTNLLPCLTGSRQWKKDFCIDAGSRISLLSRSIFLCVIIFFFPLQCSDILVQISDFGSVKADFGTDLAISIRSELNSGNSIRMLNNLIIWKLHKHMHTQL